jgi:hypothetical protein
MAQSFAMKNGSKFASEIHHSRSSSSDDAGHPGMKSANRDDEEMAKLGKRQELRVSNYGSTVKCVELTSYSVTLAS